jgi:hypothetical protein
MRTIVLLNGQHYAKPLTIFQARAGAEAFAKAPGASE